MQVSKDSMLRNIRVGVEELARGACVGLKQGLEARSNVSTGIKTRADVINIYKEIF